MAKKKQPANKSKNGQIQAKATRTAPRTGAKPAATKKQRAPGRGRGPNTIDVPLGTSVDTTVSPLGAVALSGTLTTSPLAIKALVMRGSEVLSPNSPPGSPPAAAVDCSFSGTVYWNDAVPRAHGALGAADEDNYMVVWFQAPGGGWTPAMQQFAGKSSNDYGIAVLATNCIWFSWAARTITGPYGETGDAYFPKGLAVPSDATDVTISADGLWRHDPADIEQSDADGLDGSSGTPTEVQGLEDSDYKSGTYTSLGINELSSNLNKLVGIFEWSDTAPVDTDSTDQVEIGASNVLSGWVGHPTRLFLACHDGYQWTDNSGSVYVSVSWSASRKKKKEAKKTKKTKKQVGNNHAPTTPARRQREPLK